MDWQPTRRSDGLDVAIAAGLGLLAWLSLAINGDPLVAGPLAEYARPLGIVLVVASIAPLAVRRRFPLVVCVVVTLALTGARLEAVPEPTATALALYLAWYTAGAYGRNRWSWWRIGSAVVVAALVVQQIISSAEDVPEGKYVLLAVFTAVTNAVSLAAAWYLGDLVRARRDREARLVAQAEELRATRAAVAREAVLGERVRMARELHDVLAHHVAVMGVEAGAARRVLASRPEAVPELLSSIEASSRQAVLELQGLLGLLRQDGDEPSTSPQPTLARLPELAEIMRDAGLLVDVEVHGLDEARLPVGLELSAYRIVQEALTNALKHAGAGAHARIEVRQQAASLEVAVTDDGRGDVTAIDAHDPAVPWITGHGLVGMRERVSLHGGELRTGRPRGGGFEVRAWFPLPTTDKAGPMRSPAAVDIAPARQPADGVCPGENPAPAIPVTGTETAGRP